MSVPDAVQYLKNDINSFTRESEYEIQPSFYNEANGVWLDEFKGHWINIDTIKKHIDNNKNICIVSSELHGRDYMEEWKHYKEIEEKLKLRSLMICTDYPEYAQKFFYNPENI